MKYRDPESGTVFDMIDKAREEYCGKYACSRCPISMSNNDKEVPCAEYCNIYPAEAIRLMGYEVIEEETDMEAKQDKPRICDVLGVEVGERFAFTDVVGNVYKNIWVDADGDIYSRVEAHRERMSGSDVCYLINHPECIVRRKQFTEQEVEDAKAIKRLIEYANGIIRGMDNIANILRTVPFAPSIKADAFPSIGPGESYTLDEIIGEV